MNGLTAENLPASLRDVMDVIGLPATLRLVENLGGRMNIYVPHSIAANHYLAEAIGVRAARALAEVYGGDVISNIPRCTEALRRLRNEVIRARHLEFGIKPPQLARENNLTERQIWTILSEEPSPDSGQASLF